MKEDQRNLGRDYSECFERKKYRKVWSRIQPKTGEKGSIFASPVQHQLQGDRLGRSERRDFAVNTSDRLFGPLRK